MKLVAPPVVARTVAVCGVPVPITAYAPGANPNNWWWSLRYQISTNITATATITVAIGLKGNSAHLLQS